MIDILSVYDSISKKWHGIPAIKGDSPVKGVDYFTASERQEMVDSISSDAVRQAEASSVKAKASELQAKTYADSIQDTVEQIDKRLGIASFDVDNNGNLTYTDDSGYAFEVNDNGLLTWEVTTV